MYSFVIRRAYSRLHTGYSYDRFHCRDKIRREILHNRKKDKFEFTMKNVSSLMRIIHTQETLSTPFEIRILQNDNMSTQQQGVIVFIASYML